MPALALRALARMVDEKDWGTSRHSERVADLSMRMAVAAGWDPLHAVMLRDVGLIHDVGKLSIPASILRKNSSLAPEEYEIIKRHAEIGAEMMDAKVFQPQQIDWVRHHHENPDGTGYPDRLRYDDISSGAAILRVADTYDVMTHTRPYQEAVPPEKALDLICTLCGRNFKHFAVKALEDIALVH